MWGGSHCRFLLFFASNSKRKYCSQLSRKPLSNDSLKKRLIICPAKLEFRKRYVVRISKAKYIVEKLAENKIKIREVLKGKKES